jgi:hypothetical protein
MMPNISSSSLDSLPLIWIPRRTTTMDDDTFVLHRIPVPRRLFRTRPVYRYFFNQVLGTRLENLLLLKNFLLNFFTLFFTYNIISHNQLINCTSGSISTGRVCCISACKRRPTPKIKNITPNLLPNQAQWMVNELRIII